MAAYIIRYNKWFGAKIWNFANQKKRPDPLKQLAIQEWLQWGHRIISGWTGRRYLDIDPGDCRHQCANTRSDILRWLTPCVSDATNLPQLLCMLRPAVDLPISATPASSRIALSTSYTSQERDSSLPSPKGVATPSHRSVSLSLLWLLSLR